MVEINDWLWEGLFTLKKLYDHGRMDALMEEYRNCVLSGDYVGDIAMSALEHTFEDTRMYWYTKREEVDLRRLLRSCKDTEERTRRRGGAENRHAFRCRTG